MIKEPKPAYKRYLGLTAKAIFLAEAVGVAISYGVWYKLNTSRGKLHHFKALNCNNRQKN